MVYDVLYHVLWAPEAFYRVHAYFLWMHDDKKKVSFGIFDIDLVLQKDL